MKEETIKRSLEYSREKQKEYGWDSQAVQEGYLQGVLDATRWIPVEERLPEKQGCYFVKCKTSFPKNCDVIVAEFYEDNQTFYSESSDYPIHDVISWRPIEF